MRRFLGSKFSQLEPSILISDPCIVWVMCWLTPSKLRPGKYLRNIGENSWSSGSFKHFRKNVKISEIFLKNCEKKKTNFSKTYGRVSINNFLILSLDSDQPLVFSWTKTFNRSPRLNLLATATPVLLFQFSLSQLKNPKIKFE